MTDGARPSIEVLDTTPSTMDAARANVLAGRVTFDEDGSPSSRGVLAHEQTSGRGQRGRTWHAAPGESLCVTYYIRHRFNLPEGAGRIPIMAGVVVAGFLQGLGSLAEVGLKWPNDVLLRGKKAGGILVEMVRAPDGEWVALVGIGINVFVADFPDDLKATATSLLLQSTDPSTLLTPVNLAEALGAAIDAFASAHVPESLTGWIQLWREYDSTSGRSYQTESGGRILTGVAEGIDDNGALLLRMESGERLAVTSASSLREIATND